MTAFEDYQLAREMSEGNSAALEDFVRLYYGSVLRFMRHLTRHSEDAEDLTQQTFLTAKRSIRGFRGEASLRTWIHRVAFREYLRWKRRRRPFLPLPRGAAFEEAGYARCEEARWLEAALAGIPEAQRTAFILHYLQEMPIAEVAEVLNVPIGTVKSRLFHARESLRHSPLIPKESNHGSKALES